MCCLVVCVWGCSLFFFFIIRRPPRSTRTDTRCPYTTLFRSDAHLEEERSLDSHAQPYRKSPYPGPSPRNPLTLPVACRTRSDRSGRTRMHRILIGPLPPRREATESPDRKSVV